MTSLCQLTIATYLQENVYYYLDFAMARMNKNVFVFNYSLCNSVIVSIPLSCDNMWVKVAQNSSCMASLRKLKKTLYHSAAFNNHLK